MNRNSPVACRAVELKLQRVGAWSGTAMILLYGACFSGIAKLFPPLSPTASADEIAAFFADHKLWVRFGVSGALLSASLALPFLRRDRAAHPPRRRAMGHAVADPAARRDDLRAGADVPAVAFSAAAAFGPDSASAELTQALNDVFWLWFIGIVGTIVMQNITLAIASFVDKADPPTFPRWYGYLNLWVATLSLPGCVVVCSYARAAGLERRLRLLHARFRA